MASAADIRSALSLPATHTPSIAGPSQPKKARKPEGISRELYSLLGPTPAGILITKHKPAFKHKPKLGRSTKWEWRQFKNSARTDELTLGHWVKANEDPAKEYPWAKYNVSGPGYNYTDEEYTLWLQDSNWTKEETNYLFKLVNEWDSRWYLIADRYDYPGGKERSMEDLKDRYFSACRRIVRNRSSIGDSTKATVLPTLDFDKEREVTRKKYLASLASRTAEEVAEEEALYIELKRLEQNERSFRFEREALMRTMLGVEAGLPGLPFAEDGGPFAEREKERSHGHGREHHAGNSRSNKRRYTETESPAPTPASTSAPSVSTRRMAPLPPPPVQSTASAEYDEKHCIYRPDPRSIVPTKSAHNIAFLRSGKMAVPKTTIYPRVAALLTELGVSQTRLVMPTRENLVAYETVVDACTAIVDAKKALDRIEQEIRTTKERLTMRESQSQEGGGTPMDADGEEDDGAGSSRGVSRMPSVRRSMSVSSVDTTATRGNKKRKVG